MVISRSFGRVVYFSQKVADVSVEVSANKINLHVFIYLILPPAKPIIANVSHVVLIAQNKTINSDHFLHAPSQ